MLSRREIISPVYGKVLLKFSDHQRKGGVDGNVQYARVLGAQFEPAARLAAARLRLRLCGGRGRAESL